MDLANGVGAKRQTSDSKRLLVVEGDEVIRSLCRLILVSNGEYEVATAGTIEDALQAILHRVPDLIILDTHITGQPGFDLAQQLRDNAETSIIPILFISSDSSPQVRTRALSLGDDFLLKPFDNQELLARVNARLRRGEEYHFVRQHLAVVLQFLQNVLLHEIKTPLSVLKGNNYLINMIIDRIVTKLPKGVLLDDTEQLRSDMQRLRDMHANQARAIERFQAISDEVSLAIEAGTYSVRLDKDTYTVGELLASALERLSPGKLRVELEGSTNVVLEVDKERIADAIFHLVDNAGRFNESDTPCCWISVREVLDSPMVEIEFRDNGIGIDIDDFEMVFEPFYVAHNLNLHTKGIGLGLYVAQNIVRSHGGALELTRTKVGSDDSGSVFVIRMPSAERM